MKDIKLQAIWNEHKLQRKNNSKNNIYKLHILTVKVGGNLKIYETPKTTEFYTVIIFFIFFCEKGPKIQFQLGLVKGQSWGFTSRSTARVILGQVLRIATCGTRTHRGDSLWLDAKLANH